MKNALDVMGVDDEKIREQLQRKAINLIETFDYEKKKRGDFQYRTTTSIKDNLAKTSLDRAKIFVHEIEKLLDKGKN